MALHCTIGEVPVSICRASTTEGAEHGRIVRTGGGRDTDSHEGSDDGRPDGEVGKPSKTLKGADLAKHHTKDGNDEEADDETYSIAIRAILANGNLGYRSAKTENKHCHQHEHLETLQNIDLFTPVRQYERIRNRALRLVNGDPLWLPINQ